MAAARMTASANLSPGDLDQRAAAILEAHWRPDGFTVPNAATYPFSWLWDSCFHALVWAHLGRADRARRELTHVFRTQDAAGFVPHVDYEADPDRLAGFWGRRGASSITQPPMYGHALAELSRSGVELPDALVDAARRGVRFLLERRARDDASGLITIVHPWESGADDSPRWDAWCASPWTPRAWYEVKGALLSSIRRDQGGAPLANPAFGAAPVGWNALVAFNALELASVTGDHDLVDAARSLAEAIDARWDVDLDTWTDAGPAASGSGRVRTLDALLPMLVTSRRHRQVADALVDPEAYGAPFGPTGVHRREPCFAPNTYWRGPSWPQLTYLLWVAARRNGDEALARVLARQLCLGAERSGFAEYWNPDDGTGLGAAPQSWATLAAVVAGRDD